MVIALNTSVTLWQHELQSKSTSSLYNILSCKLY